MMAAETYMQSPADYLAAYRAAKDRSLKSDSQSPLTAEQKASFAGLRYFPENPALRFELPLTSDPEMPAAEMITNTGMERAFRRIGRFEFNVDGIPQRLYLYRDEEAGYLFMPFTDGTTGIETYGAGRYLEVEDLGNGMFVVDFNMAYNPYCAYNEYWSCPIPPQENHLTVRIEAGEKAFHQ
jgi:uncharacterized protein (DUF1684 family)